MSGEATRRMIAAYQQQREPTLFFTGMFQAPPQNFHNSQEVEIDIMRGEEDVSVALIDPSTGYRMSAGDLYTNKTFVPPAHKEAHPLNAWDLLKREFGQNPYEDVQFQAKAIAKAFPQFRRIENKIRRAVELQASQVLQTGKVDLKDESGTTLYQLDYQPKSSHFPTAGTAWDQSGADPLGDLRSLGDVIRGNGLHDPDELIFGDDAIDVFLQNDEVKSQLDLRRADRGAINPEMRGNGGTFHGTLWIGNYMYNIWSYRGRYKDPQTGASTPYMDKNKVIVKATEGRLDATFGGMPRIVPVDQRVLPFLPDRMQGDRMDLWTNAWVTPDGETLYVGAGARPLMIPTAIDTFGCLDTGL